MVTPSGEAGKDVVLRLRSEGVLWSRVGDEVVVLDQLSAMYIGVNPSGAPLWELLAAGCRREDLVGYLVDTFELGEREAVSDVEAFLDGLRQEELLIEGDAEPGGG